MEVRRKHVNPETRKSVDLSFQIVDRIHQILEEKGLRQKDLAELLGKSGSSNALHIRGADVSCCHNL